MDPKADNMKLTKNFSKSEFDSKDGAEMPKDVLNNVKILAENLQVLRDAIGKPIKINSGYRSKSHNKNIGGSRNSQHLLGKAADIVVKGMTSKTVLKIIENLILTKDMQDGGIGYYSNFTHYDIRQNKSRW